ncbi:MAG: EAL domain-containing protein [Motiliproteus sp.]|nr:EAL domain-containing protein [Motiliproteus sp.]MCW9052360.1 EAL domain-containing protein [Motiliproteus sp.]
MSKDRPLGNIINLRLIAVLVTATVLIMAVFEAYRIYLGQKQFERSLEVQVQQIAERISSSVKPSIWSVYSKSIERSFSQDFASAILDSELKSEYLVAIVVYGNFGQIYMGKVKVDEGIYAPYEDARREQLLQQSDLLKSYPIKFETMTLGKVELFIDTSVFRQDQQEQLILELLQAAIISVFFVMVLFYAIKRALLAPMGRLQIAHRTFEHMGEAIAFTNVDGKIYDTNPAFRQITNLSGEQLHNCNIQDLFPGKLEKVIPMSSVPFGNSHWEGEAECHCANTEAVPVWLTISRVDDSDSSREGSKEFIFLFQDISSRKEAEKKLERLAFFDVLTDLPNRQYFENELETSIHMMNRSHQKLALLFIDVDHFKHVNDTLGHAAGDEVLVEIARRFKSRVRESDFISRIGGDEFTILLKDVEDTQQVARLAQELNEIAAEPIVIRGIVFKSGASIGISVYPEDASNASELIKNADIAMYHAKEKGRGQHSFFSSDLNAKVESYFELKNKLDLALINNEFELHYQPKVDLFSHRTVAAEGLIRWFTSDGRKIGPDSFIPLAEETRQIIPIGRWVLEQAASQLARWSSDENFQDLELSVNLSAVQLYDDSLIGTLQKLIEDYGIDPTKLEIEITETAIMQDTDLAIHILKKIKREGIKLSLDDFGSGYSSLNHLRLLPVDTLKIDRSFMAGAKEGNVSGSILTSIIKLAERLSIEVVAEGIEDRKHLEFLKAQQCARGQGYYFSPPVKIADFEKLVVDENRGSNGSSQETIA